MTADPDADAEEGIEQLSLVDLAVVRIRDLLLAGAIAPGERVREEWLTQKLKISRPPLREALQVLVQQGLLERLPRRGVRVVELTNDDISELYSLRAVLDEFALSLALPVEDSALLLPVRRALDSMRSASESDDPAAYVRANREFHVGLVRLSGHRRVTAVYETLMDQMQLAMSVNLARETAHDRQAGTKRHEELLAAIEAGDLAAATAALKAHGETRFLAASAATH